jgi:hypothetical protein
MSLQDILNIIRLYGKKISQLQEATTVDGTEYAEIVQAGQNKKVRVNLFGAGLTNKFRGAWDLSGDAPPTGTGSGSGGAIQEGDTWYVIEPGGTVDPDGNGGQFFPPNTIIIAKINGATLSTDFLWQP